MEFGMWKRELTRRTLTAVLLCVLSSVLGGCGGGGGGSNSGGGGATGNAIISGIVLLVSTNAAPTTTTTVTSGGISTTANANDGSFTLSNVPASATTLTITVSGSPNLVRTLPISLSANTTANLGVVSVGAASYDATVTGRIVTQGTAGTQGVGGAIVTIAGVQVVTSASSATPGQFTVTGLPVGLGSELGVLIGSVQASGFATYQLVTNTSNLNFPTGLVSGTNSIGDITILQPSGSTPAPPYTITGQVTVNGAIVPGQFVQLLLNNNQVGSASTDENGNYTFWVVPGTYVVKATNTQGQYAPQAVTATLTALNRPITAPTINLGP